MSVVSAIKAVTAIAEHHLIIHREQLTYYFFLSCLTWTEKREQWRQLQSQLSVVMIALHQKNKNKKQTFVF